MTGCHSMLVESMFVITSVPPIKNIFMHLRGGESPTGFVLVGLQVHVMLSDYFSLSPLGTSSSPLPSERRRLYVPFVVLQLGTDTLP